MEEECCEPPEPLDLKSAGESPEPLATPPDTDAWMQLNDKGYDAEEDKLDDIILNVESVESAKIAGDEKCRPLAETPETTPETSPESYSSERGEEDSNKPGSAGADSGTSAEARFPEGIDFVVGDVVADNYSLAGSTSISRSATPCTYAQAHVHQTIAKSLSSELDRMLFQDLTQPGVCQKNSVLDSDAELLKLVGSPLPTFRQVLLDRH
mmetsp:Transcript_127864/g.235252  ORF Transcript_127864/g.235252 Transcript_127864/m.235252 type:complete len:210 (+) Transcript_127864:1-630(+)